MFAHADTLSGPSEIGPPGDGLAAPGHEHRATFLGVGEPGGDHLTAPEGAIARRHPGGRLTLADCFRAFLGHVSPWVIAAALLAALVARVTAGHWSWRDPVIAIALVAAEPFTEWVIHVYVLHSRPVRIGGRRFDIPAAREHREHHQAPADLDGVLIPTPVIVGAVPLIALTALGLGYALNPLLGGDRGGRARHRACSPAYAILAVVRVVPLPDPLAVPCRAGAIYARDPARHTACTTTRTSATGSASPRTLGDRVIGTNPAAGDVPRSPTARNLHEALEQ